MAALPEPLFMTVEEYRQLPDQPDVVQELHWGQLVTVTFPNMKHTKLQLRLARLLRPKADPNGKTITVLSREAEARVYAGGDSIPLTLFGGALEVSRIFD